MSLETMSEAQRRLGEAGFTQQLIADAGQLRSAGTGERFSITELVVSEVVRFEGVSDPDDEAILLAVAGSP